MKLCVFFWVCYFYCGSTIFFFYYLRKFVLHPKDNFYKIAGLTSWVKIFRNTSSISWKQSYTPILCSLLKFIIIFKIFSLLFLKRDFIWILLFLELAIINIFFLISILSYLNFVFLFIYLIIAACGSVVGLSILIKINRKSKNKLVSNIFY